MTISTPDITNVKPTIRMHEHSMPHYWELSMHDGLLDLTYELRVRHGGDEDTFRLFVFDAGDEMEIVSPEELADRIEMTARHDEASRCAEHASEGQEWLYSEGEPCAACIAATREAATKAVQSNCRTMDPHPGRSRREIVIAQHLRRTWDAFALTFNPAINL